MHKFPGLAVLAPFEGRWYMTVGCKLPQFHLIWRTGPHTQSWASISRGYLSNRLIGRYAIAVEILSMLAFQLLFSVLAP